MSDHTPMRENVPMREAGASWCVEHGRWECSRTSKRSQQRCHGIAISGTPTCRMHAGKTAALAAVQGEARMLAWSAAAGVNEAPLDTGRVVMDQLRVAVLRADVYGELLRIQVEAAASSDEVDVDGLVGTTYTAGREGARVETGEAVRAMAKLEAEWRDRAVRFAKTAHDMGIDERQIELERGQAEQVVGAVTVMLEAMDLTAEQHEVGLRTLLAQLGRGGETVPEEVV